MNRCPCCGGAIASNIEWHPDQRLVRTPHGAAVLRSGQQAHLFELLWRRRGAAGFTAERLLDLLYVDDPDGGPSCLAIRALVYRMRRMLIPIGIVMHGGTGGRSANYQIELTTPEKAARWFVRACRPRPSPIASFLRAPQIAT